MTVLVCEPLGPSGDQARIEAFLWPGERADAAVWEDRSGQQILVRSRVREVDGERHRLRVRTEAQSGRELDRTWFVLGEDRFVERQSDGVLELPAELQRGTPVRPRPESPLTVHLEYVGPIRLSLGARVEQRRAMLLRLERRTDTPTEVREAEAAEVDVARRKRAGALDGERRRDRLDRSSHRPSEYLFGALGGWEQWMVEGVGEVSLGPIGEPPHRWLVGWRGGDDRLFAASEPQDQRGKAAT